MAFEIYAAGAVLRFPGWGPVEVADFQMPLNRVRSDRLGKVDLVGVGQGLWVVELKVLRKRGDGDTPLAAVLEAVGYCAVVEHNLSAIKQEVEDRSGRAVEEGGLSALVLAPEDYWRRWDRTRTPQDWRSGLRVAASVLSEATGLAIGFGSFREADIGGSIPVTDVLG